MSSSSLGSFDIGVPAFFFHFLISFQTAALGVISFLAFFGGGEGEGEGEALDGSMDSCSTDSEDFLFVPREVDDFGTMAVVYELEDGRRGKAVDGDCCGYRST